MTPYGSPLRITLGAKLGAALDESFRRRTKHSLELLHYPYAEAHLLGMALFERLYRVWSWLE
jgi:hypothetical protein